MSNHPKPATEAFNKLREFRNSPQVEDPLNSKQKIVEYLQAGVAAANENLDDPEKLADIIYDLEIFSENDIRKYPELDEIQDDIMSFEDFPKVDKDQGLDVNGSIQAWVKFSSDLVDRVSTIIKD